MSLQTGAKVKKSVAVDETAASLVAGDAIVERIRFGKHAYAVETCVKANPRKWYYRSLVTRNGREIADDSTVKKVERYRNRATQTEKTKVLWDLFVKEAATAHVDRVDDIKDRRRKETIKQGRSRKVFLPVCAGIAVIALAVYAQHQIDPKLKTESTRGSKNQAAHERRVETSTALEPKAVKALSTKGSEEQKKSAPSAEQPSVVPQDKEPQGSTPAFVEQKDEIPLKDSNLPEPSTDVSDARESVATRQEKEKAPPPSEPDLAADKELTRDPKPEPVNPQVDAPENDRVTETVNTVSEQDPKQDPKPVEASKEMGSAGTSSKEDIRNQIKAILGNTNN